MKLRKGGIADSGSILQSSSFYKIVGTPSVLLLALLFMVPLLFILTKAFVGEDKTFTLSRVFLLAKDPYTWRILRFTLFQAFISTVVSILIALPGAYLLANYTFLGKKLIKAISVIPFVLPSILVVLGFVIFYGNSGLLNQLLMALFKLEEPPLKILYTFKAVIAAHAFYNFPIALALISTFWEQLPSRYNDAAMTLGAKKLTIFRTITLPRLIPPILSASTLIFLFCFSSFAILLVLGGGPRFTTLEVEIYRRARMLLDLEGAASLSLLSIVVNIILVGVYIWTQRLVAHQEEIELIDQKRLIRREKSVLIKILIFIYLAFSSLFVLGPLGGIVYRSFTAPVSRGGKVGFTLRWYKELFGSSQVSSSIMGVAASALLLSFVIAFLASFVGLVFSTLLSSRLRNQKGRYSLSLELFAMLPMAVSSVIIGLGYLLISNWLNPSHLGSRALVVLAHVVIISPFVLRTVLPEYRKISFSYTQASLTLGANVRQTFWFVELPLLRSALITAFAFGFALSIGELNATLTLADSSLVTLPIIIYRLIGSYNFAGACALGTILILICAVVFFVSELAKRGEIK
ncbi:MAG: iron ABC transporter permease [Sphaerochaetaceae bacterium]